MYYDEVCCFIIPETGKKCEEKSEFRITSQKDPYNLTYSCAKHLSYMIEYGKINEVEEF